VPPALAADPAAAARRLNRWRDSLNPLRGLTIAAAISRLDQVQRGITADAQWTYQLIERRDEDLIGAPEAPAVPTVEDVLRKVRSAIRKADSLNDLDRRLEKIRAIPTAAFKDFHRDMVVKDLQAKLKELTGETVSKPIAKKMLAPTIENLRDQMAAEPIPDWLEHWVFVTSENVMMNTVTKMRLNREAFNGRYNKATGDKFGSNEMGVAKLSAFDAATQIFCVPMPDAIRYAPAQPDVFEEDGLLFSGDHILNGSTTVISPPDGDMRDYVAQLHRLADDLPRMLSPGRCG
jgi:hypothetical protein